MDTTIRFTHLPQEVHRWHIAMERESYERENGYATTYDFRNKVASLVNLICHHFWEEESTQKLEELCKDYSPALADFLSKHPRKYAEIYPAFSTLFEPDSNEVYLHIYDSLTCEELCYMNFDTYEEAEYFAMKKINWDLCNVSFRITYGKEGPTKDEIPPYDQEDEDLPL